MIRTFVFLFLLATPAAAQFAEPDMFRARFDACVSGADTASGLASCKNLAANLCKAEIEDGQTTLGITSCNQVEAALWDDLLNADWPKHRTWAKAGDDAERPYFDGQFTNRAETLLTAQRAWIAFRDAECALAYASWGSGSMRNIAASACMADMTADRVIALRQITEGY